MEKNIIENTLINSEELTKLPEGKCCSERCGDCTYFYSWKVSYGKCWCDYYNSYSRKSSDLACSHFKRG